MVREVSEIPDLLHPTPIQRIDVEATKLAIGLAFASGVSGAVIAAALENAKLAPSTFQPKTFAVDLFLQSFVSRCMKARIDGQDLPLCTPHLVKLLAYAPSDVAVVHHRREVLAELVSKPELRRQLEHLYITLCRFRSHLEGGVGNATWDLARRQIDILSLVKEVIDIAADGFTGATSGLARLTAFGRRVREGEPYQSLADLLRYDERLATLNMKVRVGADGRIRGFEVTQIQEDAANPFVSSPLRRWLAKIELFVRGFKFSDGEVMARLIDAVFAGIEGEVIAFVQLFGDIELYLGALGFRDFANDAGLAVCLPELVAADDARDVRALFNPLLLAHGTKPVPCDLRTDRHSTTVLVTGPNSGGKTRLLQSVGLTQLLAQGGLFVPAREARLALASGLVVSLIEEAKADQAEGRLGTELVRIRELFESLPPGAMVILDELCSGTNPSEGEEIFELVVEMLAKLAPQAFITTHFLVFAARLERERNIEPLRFLQVELGAGDRPTYQFIPGVATTSLASQAATRLGVTREQLLALVDRNTRLENVRAK
jgi:DNA mismatch repair protein MutS2